MLHSDESESKVDITKIEQKIKHDKGIRCCNAYISGLKKMR